MNLYHEIIELRVALYEKPSIPCPRAGRKVYECDCTELVLAADQAQLQVCLACPQGHKLAQSSPWPARHLLPLPARSVAAAPAPVQIPEATKTPAKPKAVRAKRQPRPKVAQAPLPVEMTAPAPEPKRPQLDCRLAELASALVDLTADGRLRVSMLDLMHRLNAANYDEMEAIVLQAGLRTSRLYGPVQAVLVDHNVRELLARAAASEVRQ